MLAKKPTIAAELRVPHIDVPSNDGSDPVPRAVRRVAQPAASPSPETRRLYRGDWARFCRWCRAQGVAALPASPQAVTAYLAEAAVETGRPALARRKAAIAAMHRAQGLAPPKLDRTALAGVRAACQAGIAPTRLGPRATPARLRALAAACPGDLAGLRDRALLLLAAATARQPGSSVVGIPVALLLMLDAEHVRIEAGGVALTVRRRADDEEPGHVVRVARTPIPATCPARALEDWLRASDTRFGPVFRKVDRWGNAEHARLGPDGLRRVVKRREAGRHAHPDPGRDAP